ncbi:MAG TPA: hypothetical protein ENK84_12665 [Desulfobulbus sp.]|nr:hypothetical protein [Desulfobulbus sp.]
MRFLFLFLICFFLFSLVSPLRDIQAAGQGDDTIRLRSNILALDRVQRNIRHSLKTNKAGKHISRREEHELLIFVDYLKERNRTYCKQLAQLGGRSAVADLPCPVDEIPLPRAQAKTTAEKISEFDRQLDASLGEFDEMLLKEQERIAAHQPRQRESGGSASPGGAGGYNGRKGGQGKSSAAGSAGGRTSGQQQKPGQTPAAGGQGQNGRPAASGAAAAGSQGQAQSGSVSGPGGDRLHSDDDIVARQLREAAEKETDPELKEKLWQEYRKYKEGR